MLVRSRRPRFAFDAVAFDALVLRCRARRSSHSDRARTRRADFHTDREGQAVNATFVDALSFSRDCRHHCVNASRF